MQQLYDYQMQQVERDQDSRRNYAAGKTLFGVSPRWSGNAFAGTLAGKRPADFAVGDWGCISAQLEILSKVSDTECLVLPRSRGSHAMLLRGLDMAKVTSGVQFTLLHPAVIQETYTYAAVSGAQQTVLVLDCTDAKVTKTAAEIAERAKKSSRTPYRRWTDTGGEYAIMGKFLECKDGRVTLERKDNKQSIDLPLARLSKIDQKWIESELKRRKAAVKKPLATAK
jgi:hypothetical protein